MSKKLLNVFHILICFLVVASCQKDGPSPGDRSSALQGTAGAPKEIISYFTKGRPSGTMRINGFKSVYDDPSTSSSLSNRLIPDWEKAITFKKGDSTIVEVPIISMSKFGFSLEANSAIEKPVSQTKFLFIRSKKKTRGVLMTIIGDNAYLDGNTDKLEKSYFVKKESNFTGMVLYHTLKGTFLNGYGYTNGVRTHRLGATTYSNYLKQHNSSKGSSIKGRMVCTSYPVYTQTHQNVYNSDGTLKEVRIIELTTYVSVCMEEADPIITDPGSGTDPGPTDPCDDGPILVNSAPTVSGLPECEEGGGGDPAPEPAPADVLTNGISDPCLKSLVTELSNTNVQGLMGKIISDFDGDTKVQINVSSVEETTHNFDAETKNRSLKIKADGSKIFSADIYLRHSTLGQGTKTTKEMAAAIFIHEALHAYFFYAQRFNGISEFVEQTNMVTNDYVGPMAAYLTNQYRMSMRDAAALVWSGLAESALYKNTTDPKAKVFPYPGGTLSKDEIGSIYVNYKTDNDPEKGIPICDML